MKTSALLFAAILFAVPSVAAAQDWTSAQENRLSGTYNRCVDDAGGVMPTLFECSDVEHDKQDSKLNQTYRMVMTRLPEARRARLRANQRRWIGVRDSTCQRAYDEAGGGQASDLEQRSCLLHQTIDRTMWLERYR